MKILIILTFLLASTYAGREELIHKFRVEIIKAARECKSQTGITEEDFTFIPGQDIVFSESEKTKCFLACVQKKINFMDDNGKFNKERIDETVEEVKSFDPDLSKNVKGAVDQCLSEVKEEDDACQKAFDALLCFQREKKARNFASFY